MQKYRKTNKFGEMRVSEKVAVKGAVSLSDAELLKTMIGFGSDDSQSHRIAKNVKAVIDSSGADGITIDDLKSIDGIGTAKAAAIIAGLEFWRRRLTKQTAKLIDSPEAAVELLDDIKDKKQEHFVLLTLNGARRLIKKRIVTIGTLMSSLIHPREVFAYAIEDRAASIIVAHNHPSGYLDISENDREVTRRLQQAGDIIGIRLDDHIIVAGDEFASAY